jgi:integrase
MQAEKTASRSRVFSNDELRAVWAAADAIDGHFSTILKLLILSGQRRTEISSLQKHFIDFDKMILRLPASLTKNARDHTVPIGALTAGILKSEAEASRSSLFLQICSPCSRAIGAFMFAGNPFLAT